MSKHIISSKKKHLHHSLHLLPFFSLCILSLFIFLFLPSILATHERILTTITQGDFNNGTFNNTLYNTTLNAVHLNDTTLRLGNYTSAVLNVTSNSTWFNISWLQGAPYGQQLPDNGAVQLPGTLGGANMTGNRVLLHLNETGTPTTFNDSSGSGNNASCTNCPVFDINGPFGGSARFNGINHSIALPSSLISASSSFAVSFWAEANASSGVRTFFSVTSGDGTGQSILAQYSVNRAVRLYFDSGNNLATTTNSFPPTGFHHFFVQYSAGADEASIYINGTRVVTGSQGPFSGTDPNVTIGSYNSSNFFNGTLDEFAVFNRTFSAGEILDIYKRSVLRLSPHVRTCDDNLCAGESFTVYNITSPQTIQGLSNSSYIQYSFRFETNHTALTPELYNVTLAYTYVDQTQPTITLNAPVNNTNTTSASFIFNFTTFDNFHTTLNCSLFVNGTNQLTNQTVANGTLTNFNFSNLANGNFLWNVTCSDAAENTNSSESRTITRDANAPSVFRVTLNPNNTAEVDPLITLNATANVSDALVNVDAVIFMWKFENETLYTNVTMAYNSTTRLYENVSIIPNRNGTINYTVVANDTLGNSVQDSIRNLPIQNETTWNITNPALGESFGSFSTSKNLGTFTLNNTGDYLITFTFTSDFASTVFNETNPAVQPKQTRAISVNATASSVQRSDAIVITANGTNTTGYNVDPELRNVTATLSAIPPGPFIDLTIEQSTTLVTQSNSYTYKVYAKNVGNETVENVTLNWTLPSGFSLTTGNLSVNISSLSVNARLYNNVTIFAQTTTPYDPDGNNTNITAQGTSAANADTAILNLTILCNGGDGICGTGCTTSTDSDCKSSTASSSGGTSGGGSGGGGGGGGGIVSARNVFKSESTKTVSLKRGQSNQFTLDVTNVHFGSIIRSARVEITGFLSKYLTISPRELTDIGYEQAKSFVVTVNAPRYLEESQYTLEALITADIALGTTRGTLTDKRIINLNIQEKSEGEIQELLEEATQAIHAMQLANIPITKTSLLFDQAQRAAEAGKYNLATQLAKQIVNKKSKALRAQTLFNELNANIAEAVKQGISIQGTQQLLAVAQQAFQQEDFDVALQSLNEAQLTYILETKSEINILKFIVNYWWAILLSFALLLLIIYLSYVRIIYFIIGYRLANLSKEEETIYRLMKEDQEHYYVEKSITAYAHQKNREQYEQRIAVIQQLKTKLRTKRVGLIINNEKELKKIVREKTIVHDQLKKVQERYYLEKSITSTEYLSQIKGFRERLVELEEEQAILEAKIAKSKQFVTYRYRQKISASFSSSAELIYEKILRAYAFLTRRKPETSSHPSHESKETSLYLSPQHSLAHHPTAAEKKRLGNKSPRPFDIASLQQTYSLHTKTEKKEKEKEPIQPPSPSLPEETPLDEDSSDPASKALQEIRSSQKKSAPKKLTVRERLLKLQEQTASKATKKNASLQQNKGGKP